MGPDLLPAGRAHADDRPHVTGSRQRHTIPCTGEAEAPPRRYFFAELETGATLAALNEVEWRGIAAADVVAVRCRPPAARRHRPAHFRVVYAR
jgi:hypothetical protein